jgi:hypothetical protein
VAVFSCRGNDLKKVMQQIDVLIGWVKGIKGRPKNNHLDCRNAADYSDALEDAEVDDELEEILSLIGRRPPRSLNYDFAHRSFAILISQDTNTIFGMSESELHDVIVNHCGQLLESGLYDETFAPLDVTVQSLAIQDMPAFLVTFPTPRTAPDAYMVCIVKSSNANDPSNAGCCFRYFTLERMEDANSKTQQTAFCEWQGSNTYSSSLTLSRQLLALSG